MKLSEIRDEVVTRSGQFILDADKLEIQDDRLAILIDVCLREFNRYSPADKHINLHIGGNSHLFTEEVDPPGVPDWIPDVLPIRSSGGFGIFQQVKTAEQHLSRTYDPSGDLVKREFVYRYRKPTLYVPFSGDFDINYVRKHKLVEKDGEKQVTTLDDVDQDASFFELLTGHFLTSIGRYRRAFTVEEAPITMDASELVSEGNEMIERAKEDMQENQHKFYLAWGG